MLVLYRQVQSLDEKIKIKSQTNYVDLTITVTNCQVFITHMCDMLNKVQQTSDHGIAGRLNHQNLANSEKKFIHIDCFEVQTMIETLCQP